MNVNVLNRETLIDAMDHPENTHSLLFVSVVMQLTLSDFHESKRCYTQNIP